MRSACCYLLLLLLALLIPEHESFHLVMMGSRRGKGGLKKTLNSDSQATTPKEVRSLNKGKGQEITGVTLPANGNVKGWEFGDSFTMVCANVNDRFYALEGQCPRCAFDLWKGDLIADDPAWEDLPRIACPTCMTTYGMVSGKRGPPVKRTGLAGFVGNLAKTATADDSSNDAKAYIITREEDGRVYCRER
ncbi:expressed unknown protein [Seminavis robusta]|uniref:Rieske domain-containing protein n=1 Tax=Seminavis robusta TaxID=568900 RepID=A0A9N8DNI7_9STRA|nr:expressed unknown protein [Seminavis robusta]|eukprot:Sro154_g069980.1 n/a (191) ;mRNA; r:36941-37771